MNWLRPIVENGLWDYCVLWKLGDDPNRFIQWMDCCCSGAYSKEIMIDEKQNLKVPICRDTHVEHPVNTMACKALAKFPSFIPLYSGVHGDVVLSDQPMWIDHANANANTNLSLSGLSNQEEVGTRLLVPIDGGLIELFVGKHVEKDQPFIDFLRAQSAQCSDMVKVEAMAEQNTEGHFSELPLLPELPLKVESSSLQTYGLNSFSWHRPDHSLTYPIFQGLSSVSNSEPPSLLSQGSGRLEDQDLVAEKNNVSGKKFQSRNLITERNRRDRIRGGLYALRALVPKISKMDKSSILADAIDYIEELNKNVRELEVELKKIEEENCEEISGELKRSKFTNPSVCTRESPAAEIQNVVICGEKEHIKASVDLHQMNKTDFLIKIISEKQQGGFVRLVQALNLMGFQVSEVNVTTSRGKVLNVLKVAGSEDTQLKTVRKTLIELMTA